MPILATGFRANALPFAGTEPCPTCENTRSNSTDCQSLTTQPRMLTMRRSRATSQSLRKGE